MNDHLRDLLGFAFFTFAALGSVIAAFEQRSILMTLYAIHNLLLAWFYMRRQPARRYDPIGLWLGMIAAILPSFIMVDHAPWYLLLPAITGYGLILWSLVILGRRFGIAPADRGLTCRGPYRYVRHPMYLGELIFRIALVLGSPNTVVSGILAGIFMFVQCWRIIREEKMIAGYSIYAKCVHWRLVPGLW